MSLLLAFYDRYLAFRSKSLEHYAPYQKKIQIYEEQGRGERVASEWLILKRYDDFAKRDNDKTDIDFFAVQFQMYRLDEKLKKLRNTFTRRVLVPTQRWFFS